MKPKKFDNKMINIHEKIQTKKQIKIYRVIAMWFDLGTLVIPVAMEAFALKMTNVRHIYKKNLKKIQIQI